MIPAPRAPETVFGATPAKHLSGRAADGASGKVYHVGDHRLSSERCRMPEPGRSDDPSNPPGRPTTRNRIGAAAARANALGDPSAEAAWLYFQDGLNQTQIAEIMGVSRASVVNYLQQARDSGLVRVQLDPALVARTEVSRDLAERYGLHAAMVVPDGPEEGDPPGRPLDRIAAAGAWYLRTRLVPGDTLGVAWGRTVHALSQHLDAAPIADVTVVQLLGSMMTPYGFSAEMCSSGIAGKLGANCINLHVPAVLTTADLAAALRREPAIAGQLDALRHCSKAVYAVGQCAPDTHIVRAGIITPAELAAYQRNGAVAVIAGRFLDGQGRHLRCDFEDRFLGIDMPDLRQVPVGILVSAGLPLVDAIHATLIGGYATDLVTDLTTARALLDRP